MVEKLQEIINRFLGHSIIQKSEKWLQYIFIVLVLLLFVDYFFIQMSPAKESFIISGFSNLNSLFFTRN